MSTDRKHVEEIFNKIVNNYFDAGNCWASSSGLRKRLMDVLNEYFPEEKKITNNQIE